jgi:glycosyltransferase involved in cell wall biosynthesis
MKVLIVRGRGIDPAVNKVAKCLSQNGYDVELLVWDRQSTVKVDRSSEYSVHRCTIRAPYDSPYVFMYLPIWWIYELYYLLKSDCDIIHACDIDTIIPAVFVKFIRKIKLCYTIYDFYADCLSPQTPRVVRGFVAFLEKYFMRFADMVVLVDESRYAQIKGAKINKIAYIYNTPPDYNCTLQNSDSLGASTFTLFYAGLLHPDRSLIYVIEALRGLEDTQLIIAGTGPERERIVKYLDESDNKLQYLGLLSYDDVIKKSLLADMLFAFYDPSTPNNRYASPNKLFESMMCGKPILTNEGTSMADIVRTENCGIIVPYGDVDAIRNAILTLRNDPALCKRLGENGRRAYETKYSWNIMEERLLKIYRGLDPVQRQAGATALPEPHTTRNRL